MSHVILYKGQSNHNVLNIFIEELASGFKQLGVDATTIDVGLHDRDVQNALKRALAEKPLGVVATNGIGQFSVNNRSLYDEFEIPLVQLLIDNPIHYVKNFSQMVSHSVMTCVDPLHLRFIDDYFSQTKTASFLPHAGFVAQKPHMGTPEIDVLYIGIGRDPKVILGRIAGAPSFIEKIFQKVLQLVLGGELFDVYSVMDHVMKDLNIILPMDVTLTLCQLIEEYLRAFWQLSTLKSLDDAGVSVDIYGDNWGYAHFKNHKVHPTASFDASINLISKAKTVLNISLMYPKGGSDCVFSAMLNGAVALSNKSTYLEDHFVDEEDILFYDWPHLDSFCEQLKELLEDEPKRQAMAQKAQAKAEKSHMWKHRVETLVDLMKGCSVLTALR